MNTTEHYDRIDKQPCQTIKNKRFQDKDINNSSQRPKHNEIHTMCIQNNAANNTIYSAIILRNQRQQHYDTDKRTEQQFYRNQELAQSQLVFSRVFYPNAGIKTAVQYLERLPGRCYKNNRCYKTNQLELFYGRTLH